MESELKLPDRWPDDFTYTDEQGLTPAEAEERLRALGLEDPMCLDTDAAVRVGVLGLRKLILRDKSAL